MNLQEMARVACYLNLATDRIKSSGGSLEWLTGARTILEGADPRAASEETQCLGWGDTLWIANNDDADTALQVRFLGALGIDRTKALVAHAKSAAALRVLPAHLGRIVPGAMTAKGTLFYSLVGNGATEPGGVFAPAAAAQPRTYRLPSAMTAALSTGLTFVTGAYEGAGGDALHAEQKLLAAFGLLCQSRWKPQGEVYVGGIKSACTTCGPVLERVYNTMIRNDYGVYLRYETTQLKEKRLAARLPVVGVVGIRSLDVGRYFA